MCHLMCFGELTEDAVLELLHSYLGSCYSFSPRVPRPSQTPLRHKHTQGHLNIYKLMHQLHN